MSATPGLPRTPLVPDVPAATLPSDPVIPVTPETVATTVDEALDRVFDPEIPVLTIRDLGILRGWDRTPSGEVVVTITPTYSGCPAMGHIEADIVEQLDAAGLGPARVVTDLSRAWTTDWMSSQGRAKLAAYGIAPPARRVGEGPVPVHLGVRPPETVACPQCGGAASELSRFGSTSCKAAYQCTVCAEPFDYFKSI